MCIRCGWRGKPIIELGVDEPWPYGTLGPWPGWRPICPRCDATAFFVGAAAERFAIPDVTEILAAVRDMRLSMTRLRSLASAAQEATEANTTPEDFLAAHPDAEPIVRVVIAKSPADWAMMVIAVVTAVLAALTLVVAKEQLDVAQAPPVSANTSQLSDAQIAEIAAEVIKGLRPKSPPPPPPRKQRKANQKPQPK